MKYAMLKLSHTGMISIFIKQKFLTGRITLQQISGLKDELVKYEPHLGKNIFLILNLTAISPD